MALSSPRPAALRLAFFFCIILPISSDAAAAWRCDAQSGRCPSVFIVHNAWHAALVLHKSDIPAASLPEISDFPTSEMIEISWGDRDYFPDPDAGVFTAIRAAFWSTGSVLHLVGFNGAPADFYRGAEIIELKLSKVAFARLIAFIAADFARAESASPAKPRPGLFSNSRFYGARSDFSLKRTCNTWVAEALNQAGVPVQPSSVIMASSLAAQLADLRVEK